MINGIWNFWEANRIWLSIVAIPLFICRFDRFWPSNNFTAIRDISRHRITVDSYLVELNVINPRSFENALNQLLSCNEFASSKSFFLSPFDRWKWCLRGRLNSLDFLTMMWRCATQNLFEGQDSYLSICLTFENSTFE